MAVAENKTRDLVEQLGGVDLTLVYVIFDSSVLDAYKVIIESIDLSKNISMREVYGMNKSLSR